MKSRLLNPAYFAVKLLSVAFVWLAAAGMVLAEVEIDLDEASKPSTVPGVKSTPTPSNASHKAPVLTPTATPTPERKAPVVEATPTPESVSDVVSEQTESQPGVVHGVVKMKDVYAAGIQSYKEKDYSEAINYLTKAVNMRDKYTPKFYYAEAYATLGLIYQFHIVHPKTAYGYYQKALKYEKNNKTARKYIKQVKKMLNKRK